jgi:hypothetical protein
MIRRFPLSVALTMLLASNSEAQTTTATSTTTSEVSSSTISAALSVGPLATSAQALPTPSAPGLIQALPGSSSGGSSAAATAAPNWLLCLPDSPASETLLPDTTLSCAP